MMCGSFLPNSRPDRYVHIQLPKRGEYDIVFKIFKTNPQSQCVHEFGRVHNQILVNVALRGMGGINDKLYSRKITGPEKHSKLSRLSKSQLPLIFATYC